MPVARSVVSRAPRCGVSSGGGSGLSGAVPCRRRRTPGRSPAVASSAGRGLGERLAPALTPVRGLCRCAVGRFPGQRHHPHGCRRRLSPRIIHGREQSARARSSWRGSRRLPPGSHWQGNGRLGACCLAWSCLPFCVHRPSGQGDSVSRRGSESSG